MTIITRRMNSLASLSRCGLVNNAGSSEVLSFAAEKGVNFDDATFIDFMTDGIVYDLSYCQFDLNTTVLELDVLCDNDLNCVCTAFYDNTKCSSCTLCGSKVSQISADCSGITDDFPTCAVECKNDTLPEVTGCYADGTDLSTLQPPIVVAGTEQASGASTMGLASTVVALLLFVMRA